MAAGSVTITPPARTTGASSKSATTTSASSSTVVIPPAPDSKHTYEQKVQVALSRAGYYHGPIDGKVGSQTREALRNFQKDRNLKADGMVGPNTWSALKPYYYGEGSQ